MLDELAATGYTGTELGDWGFMPTDPAALAAELDRRSLTLIGAFVPVELRGDAATTAPHIAHACQTGTLLAETARRLGQRHRPLVILADTNGTDPDRTARAGRITGRTPSTPLVNAAKTATAAAEAVYAACGLESAFHHHCAGIVETPDEIRRFLHHVATPHLGLVYDTGHLLYGSGDNHTDLVALLREYAPAIRLVHFKDCDTTVADTIRQRGGDYFAALQAGIFCELGRGAVPFAAIDAALTEIGYDGWIVVEQDVLPGMGAPRDSADRNRRFLQTIGL
jgi:inosose dehydratase